MKRGRRKRSRGTSPGINQRRSSGLSRAPQKPQTAVYIPKNNKTLRGDPHQYQSKPGGEDGMKRRRKPQSPASCLSRNSREGMEWTHGSGDVPVLSRRADVSLLPRRHSGADVSGAVIGRDRTTFLRLTHGAFVPMALCGYHGWRWPAHKPLQQ
jgi:hypothetical protein